MVSSPLPERIGRYEVLGRLATGGMAEILLGRLSGPSGFERPVVVKRILPHLAHSEEFSKMFMDEARLVARIRHHNVVQVYELGEADAELFLVMEYLEGEAISGILRRFVASGKRVPYPLAAYLIAEACAGLHAAHELTDANGVSLNLVHRDVSPQNVFVLYNGAVRLLDFGIAKAADRSSETGVGELKGKFHYMSPEQCVHKPLDRRSDIFSLGVVLFELTTNQRLFKRENGLMTFKAICELPIPLPSRTIQGYPPVLESVVLKALARNPDERYQTAAEMRSELLAVARKLGAGDEPAAALSALMRDAFLDRIQEKEEMLRRVGAGSAPKHIPANDADSGVELPNITDWASSAKSSAAAGPGRRATRILVLAVALAAIAGVVALVLSKRQAALAPSEGVAATPAELPSPSEVKSTTSTPRSSPQSIVLSIASRPSGATVFLNGEDRGSTPRNLEVPRSDKQVTLRIERPGFQPLEKQVVPDQARSFDLALVPIARSTPNTKPGATQPKSGVEVPLF